MAITGTITGTTSNQYIDAKIEYSYTQDTENNTSTITATLYFRRNNTDYTTSGTGTFSIAIAGSVQTITKYMNIGTGWANAGSITKTVSHNADGSKSVSISASGSMPDTTLTATSCSGTVKLNTIPRASTITTAAQKNLGSACAVTWTPLSKSFRYKLQFTLGGWLYTTGAIHPNTTSAYTYKGYTLPLTIANQLSSAKTGTMTVVLTTYSDSEATTKVGSSSSKTFTVTVPDNSSTKPTVTMTLSPVHSLGSAFDSVYVQGKSKVQADLSAEGQYSATIKSYSMSALGKSDTSSPYQSGYLTTSGTVTVTGKATDSRGYTGSKTEDITVIAYSNPKILPASGENEIICARCDSSGELSESGTYLKIKAKRSYSKVTSSGSQKNFCSIRYRYKAESATSYSSWTTILASSSTSSDEIETGALLGGVLLSTKSYMVQVGVIDDIGEEDAITIIIPTDKVYMHRAGSINALGIGKYAEESNSVDIADDINVYGRVYGLGKTRIAIQSNEDLNSFLTFGVYAVTSNAIAKTISNIPVQSAGRLIVSSGNGSGKQSGTYTYILQEYITFNGYYHCYREAYTSDDATVWYFNKWEIRSSTYWVDLGLSENVSESTYDMGRTPYSCAYRVDNGNHVYVAFNCSFTWSNASLIVNGSTIPEGYRPARNMYAFCPLGGKYIARCIITTAGNVVIEWVQNLLSTEETTSRTGSWIDGYIDYWV